MVVPTGGGQKIVLGPICAVDLNSHLVTSTTRRHKRHTLHSDSTDIFHSESYWAGMVVFNDADLRNRTSKDPWILQAPTLGGILAVLSMANMPCTTLNHSAKLNYASDT